MEDDDGLLLNFATSDNSSASSTNLKSSNTKVSGGRWKDRRKLQLSLQGRGRSQKKNRGAVTGPNSSLIVNSRLERSDESIENSKNEDIKSSGKRPVPAISANMGLSSKKIKFAESKGESGGKNNSYVSSLFTSNQSSSKLLPTDESNQITYSPSNAPLKDATTFEGLGLNEKLSKHLTETLRFKNPTKIQRSVIPKLLTAQRDLFVKAQTGSGKTLSFLLPIFHKLMSENKNKINRDSGLFAIILTPTRELASQIYGVMETITRSCHHIVPGIVVGGEKKKSEKARIRKGVNILVATPGRLADHMENTSSLDVSQLRWLILDEGDKLVELGFEETITKITEKIDKSSRILEMVHKWQGLPTERINILCSATMQNNVKKLGSIILNDAEMISVDTKDIDGTIDFDETIQKENVEKMLAPDQLVQKVVVIPPKLRLVALSAMLKKLTRDINQQGSSSRTIIFFSCSDSVDFHFDVFTRNGNKLKKIKNSASNKVETVEAENNEDNDVGEDNEENLSILTSPVIGPSTVVYKLHGSLSQQVRTSTLQSFIKNTSSRHSILLCTDVASRGLDLPNISTVIEYDPPFTIEDHLHRIGRSARVGNEGNATLFLLPGSEEGYVDGKMKVVHPKEGNLRIVKYEGILKDGFANTEEGSSETKSNKADPKKKDGKWDIHATTWHLDVERWLLEDSSAHDKAVQTFTSHIRAYATHLATERSFFNVKLLHLGHLAKSFGLRETPKKLGKSVGSKGGIQTETSKKAKKEDPKKKMLRMARTVVKASSSEFNY